MASIPPEDRAANVKDLNLFYGMPSVQRALGVEWCIEVDSFKFYIALKDQPLTRRGILSTVCLIYDPLGFVAPVTLVGKQILQQMCQENADWDHPLSDKLRASWEQWRQDLFQLEDLNVKRCFKADGLGIAQRVELHHFSDATTKGYGQCSYLHVIDDHDTVHCSFVIGKARVVPLKPVTIPRLELTATVVSVKMSDFLHDELDYKIDAELYWTGSRVALGYISNESRRFHVFVANRVQRIRERTTPAQWRYMRSEENPADVGSRGLTAKELVTCSKWISGPDFLWKKDPLLNIESDTEFPIFPEGESEHFGS